MLTEYTVAEAKKFLRGLKENHEYVLDLVEIVKESRSLVEGTSATLSDTPTSLPPDPKRIAKGVAALIEAERRYEQYVSDYAVRKSFALATIYELTEPSEKRVLLLYYFPKKDSSDSLFRTWEEVAGIMKCDVRTAQRYHGKALLNFIKKAKEQT